MDTSSPGQLSVSMPPGQSPQSPAPTPVSQSLDSESFDPEVTLSRGRPIKLQETMFPSESQNVVSQEEAAVSAGGSEPNRTGGNKVVVSMSEAVTPVEKSQPKLQPQSQANVQPPSQPQPQPKSPPKAQPASQPQAQSQTKLQSQSQAKSQPKLQPKSKLARKRRLLLVLVVVAVTPLIGTAGVFFWWQHYKTTPAYQLALLFDAVHRNDNATVDQIVAMDSITESFASQVTQNVLSQKASAATDSERKQLESSVTGLTPSIKQTVRQEVDKQVRDEAAPSAGKSFLMMALAVPYKVGITQAGDTATVAAQAHPVSWTMQRSSGGPWTIVAVKDDALASRIQEQVTSELPATAGEKTQAGTSRQKNPVASAQQKNSTDSARARKKERKKPERGITIDLRKIPWPE